MSHNEDFKTRSNSSACQREREREMDGWTEKEREGHIWIGHFFVESKSDVAIKKAFSAPGNGKSRIGTKLQRLPKEILRVTSSAFLTFDI